MPSLYGSAIYGTSLYGDRGQLGTVGNLIVELRRNGQWRDITVAVRADPGITLQRGYAPDSTALSPGVCSFVLENANGAFSPRFSGSLVKPSTQGRNMAIRVGLGTQIPGNGEAITTGASRSSIAATAPFDGNHEAAMQVCLFAASPVLNVTAPAGMTERNETDGTYATFSVCDLAIAASGSTTRTAAVSPNTTASGALNVALPGTWTQVDVGSATGGASAGLDVDTANGRYVFVGQAWSADPKNAMVPPFVVGDFAPEWVLVGDSKASTGPRAQGWWAYFPAGVYTLVVVGDLANADCYGVSYQSSDAPPYSPRFTGVVREWPVGWDETGRFVDVSVQAMGGLYQGRQDAISSSPARVVLGRYAQHYWPMEDDGGPGFSAATAGTPRLTATSAAGFVSLPPEYAAYGGFVGSSPLPTFTDAGAYATLPAPIGVGATGVVASLFVHFPASATPTGAGANLLVLEFTGGQVNTIGVEYTSNTVLTTKITYSDGTATYTAGMSMAGMPGGGIDGRDVVLLLSAVNNGTAINWSVGVEDVGWANGYSHITYDTGAVSIAAKQFGSLTGVRLGLEVGSGATLLTSAPALGHLAIAPGGQLDADQAIVAAIGASQWGLGRWVLYGASPVPASLACTLESGFEVDQGPLIVGSVATRLQSMADTSQGLVFDPAGFVGVSFVDRSIIESSATAYTFDYTAKQLASPLAPVDDDQTILNRVRVNRPDPWGGASSEAVTGLLGIAAVGPYSQDVTAFPVDTATTEALAQWLVAQGTVDAQRWPEVTVEWSAATNATNASLIDLTIGRWIALTNLPSFVGPNVELQIVGIRETYTSATVRTTYVTRPAEGWRVLVWDDASFGVWADSAAPASTDNRWAL